MVAAPLSQNHLPPVDESAPFSSFDVPTKIFSDHTQKTMQEASIKQGKRAKQARIAALKKIETDAAKERKALEKELEASQDDELNTSADSDQATIGVVHPGNPNPGIDGQTTDGDQGIPNATTMKTENIFEGEKTDNRFNGA